MGFRVAVQWLHSCAGCEMAMLDMGPRLLTLLEEIELVHMPLLVDHKYHDPEGAEQPHIPAADLGIVTGAVANSEQLALLRVMRRQCRFLLGVGTCASHGGIPAMINAWPMAEALAATYQGIDSGSPPAPDQVPQPLDRVRALDEEVEIDLLLPGCPPGPGQLEQVLTGLVAGKRPATAARSVCDTCPTRRLSMADRKQVRRFVDNEGLAADQPVAAMRCLLEQGLLCMGPVTAGGCDHDGAPACIGARVPCRGCFGPVEPRGNQMLAMMNILASHGLDFRSVVDRRAMLRFAGAHGLLRPIMAAKRKGRP